MTHRIKHLLAFVNEQLIDAISVAFDSRFAITDVTLIGQAHALDDIPPIVDLIKSRLKARVRVQELPSPAQVKNFEDSLRQIMGQGGQGFCMNLNTEDAASACLAYDMARQLKIPVFAVDTRSDRLIWLYPRGETYHDLDIEDRLGCADVFEMHGYNLQRAKPMARYIQKLACSEAILPCVLKDENLLTRMVPQTGLTANLQKVPSALVKCLKNHHFLIPSSNQKWVFPDVDVVAFLRGGWLELVVFERFLQLAHKLKLIDVRHQLQLKHRQSGQNVEFDIACMVNNQLHLIECKSGDSRGAKFISHLEGITRSHGLRARCMLVSVDTLSDSLVGVAEGMHIAVVHGAQLVNLENHLTTWLEQAHPG